MWYLQNPFLSCRESKSFISSAVPNAFSCKWCFQQKKRTVKIFPYRDKEPPKLYLAAPQWKHRHPSACQPYAGITGRATIVLRAKTLHHVWEVHSVRRQTRGGRQGRSGVTESTIALPRGWNHNIRNVSKLLWWVDRNLELSPVSRSISKTVPVKNISSSKLFWEINVKNIIPHSLLGNRENKYSLFFQSLCPNFCRFFSYGF